MTGHKKRVAAGRRAATSGPPAGGVSLVYISNSHPITGRSFSFFYFRLDPGPSAPTSGIPAKACLPRYLHVTTVAWAPNFEKVEALEPRFCSIDGSFATSEDGPPSPPCDAIAAIAAVPSQLRIQSLADNKMARQKAMRLPPLQRIYVRNPNKVETNTCLVVMSQVLCMRSPYLTVLSQTQGQVCCSQMATNQRVIACWASAGYSTAGCGSVEQALRECMDKPRAPPKRSNNINYHLNRLSDRLTQQPGKK